ncbi:MAG: PHP domain-containing protein [Eubacteriales bacterium]|nr:PHP domain-containing protein [Eubacteriales bacterium]
MLPCELKERLKKEYCYRIELHAHTCPASGCSQITPKMMVETYAKKGFDGVVITNHFFLENLKGETKEERLAKYISDYEETVKAAEGYNIKVFLGAELRFPPNCNDYMLYGADYDILSTCYDYLDKEVSTFRKEVKLPDSVFLQAHPFRNGIELCEPSILDGIESFNMHPGHNSRVGIAARYAKEQNFKIQIAGSDFHHPDQGHEAVSALRTKVMPKTSFDIAKILRSGDYIFEIGENTILLP